MSHSKWQEILARVRQNIPMIVEDFRAELDGYDGYAPARVPQEDVTRSAFRAFELFLAQLEGVNLTAALSEFPESLGRRRARQGLRVDQFTEAVRVNFRLLWRALLDAAEADLANELVLRGECVMTVVEKYATDVQRAFLDEIQVMEQLQQTTRERVIARLFSGLAEQQELEEIAATLGIFCNGTYEMLAVPVPLPSEMNDLPARHRESGVLRYEDGEMVYQFRNVESASEWRLMSHGATGVYISRIEGLGEIVVAAALARRLAKVRGGAGVLTLRQGFAALLAPLAREQFAGFEYELLGEFENLPIEKQTRFANVLVHFMSSGSVQQTADALYMHRNTVFKRIRAFAELTGLDVTVPRDAAIALIMLQARLSKSP